MLIYCKFSFSDFSKWLKKSVPAGSSESSLPGKRVEFPDIPLSAFRRPSSIADISSSIGDISINTVDKSSLKTANSSENDKWLKNPNSKWLVVPSTSQTMDVDLDDDDEDEEEDLMNQWLLVDRNVRKPETAPSGMTSGSIEDWLLAAADDREPSIVVIDDEFDDVTSGFSGDFGNFR